MEQEILDAQERLLKKREELKVMGSPIPSIMNSEGLKVPFLIVKTKHGKNEMKDVKEETEKDRKIHQETPEKIMKSFVPKKFLDRSLDSFEGAENVKKVCLEYVGGF